MDGIQFEANQHSCPLSSRCLSCPCMSAFSSFSAVFRFFSRIRYLCRARGNILPTMGFARPVFFYYPMTRKRERMSTEVSTITSCSRKQSYITTTVVEMSEKNLFSSPENISRNYLCYKLQEWLSFV